MEPSGSGGSGGDLRIISGEFKGRKLMTPRNGGRTHPMGERERLALFNSLGDLSGVRWVLDCYAGSGALGFEVLSRSYYAQVLFIEKDTAAMRAILTNRKNLEVRDRAYYLKDDMKRATVAGSFDLIFVDPPYNRFVAEEFNDIDILLAPGGRLVLSHPSSVRPEKVFPKLKVLSSKKYARANLTIFGR